MKTILFFILKMLKDGGWESNELRETVKIISTSLLMEMKSYIKKILH